MLHLQLNQDPFLDFCPVCTWPEDLFAVVKGSVQTTKKENSIVETNEVKYFFLQLLCNCIFMNFLFMKIPNIAI